GQKHEAVKRPRSSQSPEKYMRKVSKSSKPTFKASDLIPIRKSNRLLGKCDDLIAESELCNWRVIGSRPDFLGTSIIHRGVSLGLGIHGNPAVGCYSPSSVWWTTEDDVDLGDSFIYAGEGGEFKELKQIKESRTAKAGSSFFRRESCVRNVENWPASLPDSQGENNYTEGYRYDE
ncbi:hypothetical protein AVEN_149323-1, partial [Araneus ventricosus]